MAWTSPRTWVSGEKPSASTLNTHIRDNLKAIGDAWASYVPSTANLTLGNGSLTGAKMEAGKLFAFRIKLVFGSTTALTGSPTFGLPVTAVATRSIAGGFLMNDSSGPFKGGFYYNSSATVLSLRDDASAALSSTNPFTWTTDDEIVINGTGEAA